MIAIIDNYDSFTYNLAHYVGQFSLGYTVFRNDEVDIEELTKFDKIIISPGPGMPDEVPLLKEILGRFATTKPILGVCLGMQAIAEFYGAKLLNLSNVMHGIKLKCEFSADDHLFKGIKDPFYIGHYHSWVVDSLKFPAELKIIAMGEKGNIMAIKHNNFPLYGIQFHPESVLTPQGINIIKNWCEM
jgi:anthranilate synthase component 2